MPVPEFSFQLLLPQDEPFLWDMLYQAIYVPEGQAPPPRSVLEEPDLAHYVQYWGQRPGDLGVKTINSQLNQPVGAAWLRLFTAKDKGYGYINDQTPEFSIALLPDYRGMGLGTRLMEELFQAARPHFRALSLSVSRDNPALRLYQHFGFQIVASDNTSLTMRKEL